MLYRICTADINQKKIERIVSQKYDGFTILKSTGFWKQTKENSLIIEIVTSENDFNGVKSIAKKIKKTNNQDAVLIQKIDNNQLFV